MAIHVLLCYSQQDESKAKRLKEHLSMLQYRGLIDLWDHGSIGSGIEWEQAIREYFEQAQIILLLISHSFLGSHYHYTHDIQKAIKRHEHKQARVIPVIISPVHWKEPPIDKLQALPDREKPVSSWSTQNHGFKNVVDGIIRVIEQWDTQDLAGPSAAREALMRDLTQFIAVVKVQMQPSPRAIATTNTLQQLSLFIPIDVTLADLMLGWQTLSHAQQNEEASTAQRRVTCSELSVLARQCTQDKGNLDQAVKTWDCWLKAFTFDAFKESDQSASNDPRQVAMGKTFARELAELQAAASRYSR